MIFVLKYCFTHYRLWKKEILHEILCIFCAVKLHYDIVWVNTYIPTYHSFFIPDGIAEVFQIFLRDTHVLTELVSYEEHCRRDRWLAHRHLIAVYLINPLVAFYDIHGGKREVIFFYFVPNTTRDNNNIWVYVKE
jgi:hypothetical protein